jgi:hypothetical protein
MRMIEPEELEPNDEDPKDETLGIKKIADDPFDPANLGLSTEFAQTLSATALNAPIEFRKPNDQEFFRTSLLPEHTMNILTIADKQDMGKIYVVLGSMRKDVLEEFPRFIKPNGLILAQTLTGQGILWPFPMAGDRGNKANSTQRSAVDSGKTKWTNFHWQAPRYVVQTIENPREVDWTLYPPFKDVLRQALSERLIDSPDHALLNVLRGKVE